MTDESTTQTSASPVTQWKNPDFYIKGIAMALSGLIVGNVIPIASGWYKAAIILATMLSAFGFPVLMSTQATSARSSAYSLAPLHKRSAWRMLGMLAGVAVAILVMIVLLGGCGSTQLVAAEKTAAACVVGDVVKYAGDVQTALAAADYDAQLKAVATKAGLTADALTCLVDTVLGVLTAEKVPSTAEPSVAVQHGRAWMATRK